MQACAGGMTAARAVWTGQRLSLRGMGVLARGGCVLGGWRTRRAPEAVVADRVDADDLAGFEQLGRVGNEGDADGLTGPHPAGGIASLRRSLI